MMILLCLADDALLGIRWRRVILDEAHQIRNYKSRTSQAICELNAQSRWAVSGLLGHACVRLLPYVLTQKYLVVLVQTYS